MQGEKMGKPQRFIIDPEDLMDTAWAEQGAMADMGRLESVLAAPCYVQEGHDLFAGVAEKAALLFGLMIKSQPFQSGNKRMAIMATMRFIELSGMSLTSQEGKTMGLLALLVASDVRFGDQEMGTLREWFRAHLAPRPPRPPRLP
jgi:death-on-curing protein